MKNIIILLFLVTTLSCSEKEALKFPEKLYPIEVNEKYGYINVTGEKVIDALFDEARDFNDSFAIVTINKKEGVINLKGEFIINPTFDEISFNKQGYFALKIANNLYKLKKLNEKGTVLQEPIESIMGFGDSLFRVYVVQNGYSFNYLMNGKGQRVSQNFKTIINNGSLLEFSKGKQVVGTMGFEDKYGLMDYHGKIVLNDIYESIGEFNEGLMGISLNGYYGFLDTSFKMKIYNKYYYASDFSEGLADCAIVASPTELKYGYIDRNGKTVIPFSFDDASHFENGVARVGIGQNRGGQRISMEAKKEHDYITFGFIDKKGKFIIPPIYKSINSNSNFSSQIDPVNHDGMIVLQYEKKFGAFDTLGKQIIPFEYDFIDIFRNNLAKYEKNDEKGIINSKGEKFLSVKGAKSLYFNNFDENGIAKIVIDDRIRYVTKRGKYIW